MCFKATKRWLKFLGTLPALLGLALFLITLSISIDFRILYFQGMPPSPTKEEWIKDVHFLANQMKKIYPDFKSRVSDELLVKTVKDIETRIPELSESDIVMEFFRLSALPNDAHSIPFVFFPCFDLHDFPIKIFRFDDGWYIIDASRAYSNLVGNRILKVGTANIEDLFQKFKPYLSAENEYAQLERFTYIGLMPEWLKSQGVIDNLKKAQFTLEKQNSEQVIETLNSVSFPMKFYWSFLASVDNKASSAFLSPRKDSYWFEFLESSKTIYFQFNEVENQKGKESISKFAKRLKEFANTHDFDRFIVDLRNNMGGDDSYLKPLLELIRDNKKINQRNKLFVLTGRHSFSSAVLFAYKLKLQTKAIFVGEPTAQGPIFGGNPTQIELPNSKLVFVVATTSTARTQAKWPFEIGNAINPDTLVKYSYADFKAGKDPVLVTALNYKSDEPLSKVISETILNQYSGRFLLSPWQILEVKRNGTNLSFTIDDFTSYNLFRVQSDLFAMSESEFKTDIENVSISFPKDSVGGVSSLILNWEGQKRILKRAPKDYTLALELLSQKRTEEAILQINLNKAEYSKYSLFEDQLTVAGYDYLNQNKTNDAIKIFNLITELFPESWNAYDSLGEAYMKAGNKELAIENYEKSLKLNPNSKSGTEALKKLRK